MHIENISYWLSGESKLQFDNLAQDIDIDIAIIGGGISGLTTALLLSEYGEEVAVFEANKIGYGATGFTTAKVTAQHGLIYSELAKQNDEDTAKIYANANQDAISNIERIINKYKIECDYQKISSNIYASEKNNISKLKDEYKTAKSIGLPVYYFDAPSFPFKAYASIQFKNQGMFHPIKYINGLTNALKNNSRQIYEDTRIVDIQTLEKYILTTNNGYKITANKIVIATKYPILNKKSLLFTKLHLERSYVVAAHMPNTKLDGYYINIEDKVKSLRPYTFGDEALILIAGGNHKAGECDDTKEKYTELINFAKSIDKDAQIKYKWSTQDCMTLDKIPYIGRISDDMTNVFIMTGYNKWGMTQSMVASTIISDIIINKDKSWHNIYDPKRSLTLPATKELFTQGADVAKDYIKMFLPVKTKEIAEIKPTHAKIVKIDGETIGVYKDEHGKVFAVSPFCRHLGCLLSFNTGEKTWDCPCHGSRYTYLGEVIDSPAVKPLHTINLEISNEEKK